MTELSLNNVVEKFIKIHNDNKKLLAFVKEISDHVDDCVSPGIQREAKRLLKEIGEL